MPKVECVAGINGNTCRCSIKSNHSNSESEYQALEALYIRLSNFPTVGKPSPDRGGR